MMEKKEPVAGNLDQAAEAMAALGLGQVQPVFAAGAAQPPREMRADARPQPQHQSHFDLWLAGVIFTVTIASALVYFVVR
jgi:hypothetical protein